MSELELRFPIKRDKKKVMEYLQEHYDNNEYELNGDGGLDIIKDFDKWLEKVNDDLLGKNLGGRVPSTQLLAIRKTDRKVIGMIRIRHDLTEDLLDHGGNIGYGVRPTERKNGYAREMLRLALEKCKELSIDRALVTCIVENIASAKVIVKNGGILENEVMHDNNAYQRYWIDVV